MNNVNEEIKRLNFEDFLLVLFICSSILNIIGDSYEKEYLKTHSISSKINANKIFDFTLSITILIYFYFLIRNYNSYKNISEDKKSLYSIKLFGSILIVVGAICLLYFQKKQNKFVGVPAI